MPIESTTFTVKLKVPPTVGVPVTPAVVLLLTKVDPDGKLPAVIVNV